jgi:ribonuclease D
VITSEASLKRLLSQLESAEWVAMDTEADSLHCYPERLCLVQISIAGAAELIDPLAGLELAPLWEILRSREILMHGADYDLRLLHRGCGFVPRAIFDTMLAERFLGGVHFGLTDLAAKYLNVTLEKGPQKANWARRPLTERMAAYARNDTRYLYPLACHLRERLEKENRLSWHAEACSQLIANCTSAREINHDDHWRIKGSERLCPRALSVLHELWRWREVEALAVHKPPYFILSHEVLVHIAAQAVANHVEALIPPHLNVRRRGALLAAVARGLDAPEHALPLVLKHTQKRLSDSAHQRLEQLKNRRDRHAAALGLDPSFIASRATLIGLADNWPVHSQELMAWQLKLLEAD